MEQLTPTIRNPKFWVPSLYLAQGLPFFAVMIVANQMLKSMGVPNDELNHWTGLIGFAWALKPFWSPFLELASSKKLIVVTFQILGGLCLGGVALSLHTPFWFAACLAMLALVAICAATHDIACDGLYSAALMKKARPITPAGPVLSSMPENSLPPAHCCCWQATSKKHSVWYRHGPSASASWRPSWSCLASTTAGLYR